MLKDKILKGDTRTVLMKKNILGSFLIKGWSCAIQLLLIPATLHCLTAYEYGVWLTISSILVWIDQFDIGLGNGLRNKLAEAMATSDQCRACSLVSTTLFALVAVILPLIGIILFVISHVDVYVLLNASPRLVPHLQGIVIMTVAIVGTTFIFKLVGNIYLALQLPAINNLLVVSGQTLSLVGIFVLILLKSNSLFLIASIYTVAPLLVYLVAWCMTVKKYPFMRPSIQGFSCKELKGVLSLGIEFFVIQLAGLMLFTTSTLLISRLLSPAEVTVYQVAYRYFSLPLMFFSLIAAPLWSATTDAYAHQDMQWIRSTMRKIQRIMGVTFLVLAVMVLLSEPCYHLWVGESIHVGYTLSIIMAMYVAILIFSTSYSNILFGMGKLHVIIVVTCIEAIIYIPLAIYAGKEWGIEGIVGALATVNLFCAVTNKIQYERR